MKNRKKFKKILTIVIIVAVITIFLRGIFYRLEQNKSKKSYQTRFQDTSLTSIILDHYTLNDAIKSAAEFLQEIIEPNGQFVYRINLNPDVKVKKKYNMLRHAGTMYALAMYHDWYHDSTTLMVLESASEFLKDNIAPLKERDDLLAVWSIPEITGSNNPLQAKLGGAGLGLVALAKLEMISHGSISHNDLRKLGQFIIYMQKEDGSFYSKYYPEKGRYDKWVSLYYPGEAALGLLMLYQIDPSPIYLDAAAKALEYLAKSRKNSSEVPADHWALIATKKLFELCPEDSLPVSRELLIDHALQVSDSILQEQVQNPMFPEFMGSFSQDGRTTPTATRIEGLMAVLDFLPDINKSMRYRIELAVEKGIRFLLRTQICSGKYAGAIPRALRQLPENFKDAKNLNRRATELRIDYTQHAMCAMMQYLQYMDR